ncbi:hypothetical protein EDC01DRAFT_368711 [Geopyxis carbonaria]|nr:hypothetical protein EDC01DRAFT_368711 [Geopyxis carbonaria]
MSDQITPDRGRNRYDNHSTDHFYTRHRPNNEKRYPRPSGSERFYVPQESFYGSDTYRPLYEPARPSSSKSSRPGTPISRKREMGKSSPDQINTRESTGSGSNPHYKNRWTDRPRDSSDDPAKISSSLNGVGKSLNCNNRPANGNGDNQSEPHTAPKLNLKSVPEQISLESRKSLPHEESYTRSSLAMGAYSYVEKYDSTGVHMQENGHPTMSFQP